MTRDGGTGTTRSGDAGLGFERLRSWALDESHTVQSVRHNEPQYRNPGELRADVRELLARHDAVVLHRARMEEVRAEAFAAFSALPGWKRALLYLTGGADRWLA